MAPTKRAGKGSIRQSDQLAVSSQVPRIESRNRSRLTYIAIIALLSLGIGYISLFRPSPSRVNTHDGSSHLDHSSSADIPKRDAVVAAFKHAWSAYEEHAYGTDNYHSLSRVGSNMTAAGGIGYTIVDSIDTIMLMGLEDEYERARSWIETDLSFDRDAAYNTFETTIRVLGGLLSAYYLSSANGNPDPLFLERAVDLGDRLLGAFKTPFGLPLSQINLATSTGIPDTDNYGKVSTAEAASLQLELKYLSYLTDDDSYWHAAEGVMRTIKNSLQAGLAPVFMRPDTGKFVASDIRLGSRGDSYYEYLLKQYLQTDRTETVYRDMYDSAMSDIQKHLMRLTPTNKMLYTVELHPLRPNDDLTQSQWRLVPKQDHLVCFLGGSLLLGVTEGYGSVPPDTSRFSETDRRDWRNGIGLIKTCMETHQTRTGLSPEIVHFRSATDPDWVAGIAPNDWYIKGMRGKESTSYDARYMLRPETVESLFLAYRLTGEQKYRDWGWQIFQAIETHCKLKGGGYATVLNVDAEIVTHDDRMETFFMSETLKYLYLLFDDQSRLPLKEVVFNTEAHIFPVFTPTIKTGFA